MRLPRPKGTAGTAVVGLYGAGVLALFLVTTLELGAPDLRRLLLDMSFLLGSLAFLGAGIARVAAPAGRDRRGWLLLASAAGLVWGNGWWFWYQEVATSQPHPSWSDLGYMATLGFLAATVSTYLPRTEDRRVLLRFGLDGLLMALGLFTVLYLLYVEESVKASAGTPLASLVVSTTYPVVEVLLLTLVLLALRNGRAADRSLQLLGVALVFYLMGDTYWNFALLNGGYVPGSAPLDATWVLAYGVLALVAASPTAREAVPFRSRLGVAAAVTPFAFALVAGMALLLLGGGVDSLDMLLLVPIGVLTLARQVLTAQELTCLNGTLAAEVAEQTELLRSSHDQMHHLAMHDALTGLANRRRLKEALDGAARPAAEGGRAHALLLFDLDNFKGVNDGLGHDVGDRMLTHVARRLQSATRADDVVARLGGDEFAVVLWEVSPARAHQVAERCLERIRQPFAVAGQDRLMARASAGVVMCLAGDDPGNSLRRADVAMYAAKAAGRNRVEVYDDAVHNVVLDMHQLESSLFLAPAKGELVLHYQPVVDLASGGVVGHEALVRWMHPERGMIPPDEFIALAERIGAIDAIGLWVLEDACRQLVVWLQSDVTRPLRLAVNLSPLQLDNGMIVRNVQDVLARTGAPADHLVLEVTESALHNAEEAREVLGELRALGIAIALDDFGSGYSSLGQLRDMPVDILKIDRSFVRAATADAQGRAYLRTIVELGQILGMAVCAEGIEDKAQRDVLYSLGCDLGQGWLFGRPVPAAEVPAPRPLATT